MGSVLGAVIAQLPLHVGLAALLSFTCPFGSGAALASCFSTFSFFVGCFDWKQDLLCYLGLVFSALAASLCFGLAHCGQPLVG